MKKSNGIGVLLSFFLPGAGSIYADKVGKGVGILVVAMVLGSIALASGGVGFIISIPFGIWSMFAANSDVNEFNALNSDSSHVAVHRPVQSNPYGHPAPSNQLASGIPTNPYTQSVGQNFEQDFVRQITQSFQLYQAEVLSEHEFVAKKNSLIASLAYNKPAGDRLNFLTNMLSLVNQGALTTEDLQRIKNFLL